MISVASQRVQTVQGERQELLCKFLDFNCEIWKPETIANCGEEQGKRYSLVGNAGPFPLPTLFLVSQHLVWLKLEKYCKTKQNKTKNVFKLYFL